MPEFFEQYRNEVESMFTLIYDDEMAKKVAREEGKEEGREEGKELGIAESLEILQSLKDNKPTHEIASKYAVSIEQSEKFRLYTATVSA